MSGEKPAPTAAEISKARDFLDDRYLDNVLSLEFPRTVDHIRTLLAALDAAEARATAEGLMRDDAVAAQVANLHRAETAERERDEARAALVAIQERRFPIQRGPSIRWSVLAPHEAQARRNHSQTLEQLAERHGLDPVEAMAVYEDREYPRNVNLSETMAAWRALVERTDAEAQELAFRAAFLPPGAIVVEDSPETVERVAQALMTQDAWNPKTLSELDDSNRSCHQAAAMRFRAEANAVLAALREVRP